MNLLMDKANFLSLLRNKETWKDCKALIEKGINIILNFNKEELLDLEEADKARVNAWINTSNDGNKKYGIFHQKLLDTKNLKTNFIKSIFKIQLETQEKLDKKFYRYGFLLDNEMLINHIKGQGTMLVGKVGEESEVILSLQLENTETPTCKIRSWKDYVPHLSVSNIIICDNHYFKTIEVYHDNKTELIKALCANIKNSPVNCIIIAKADCINNELDIAKEQIYLQTKLKKLTKSSNSNLSIVLTYSTHDRDIITDFYRIKNGTCFHLNNNIKKNVTTEIKTHANKNNEEISDYLVETYKEIVSKNEKTTYGKVICDFFE